MQALKRYLMLITLAFVSLTSGCLESDPNAKPAYGKESGLPKNCRAMVQAEIDAYRAKAYSTEDIMLSLERNCGINGHLWTER